MLSATLLDNASLTGAQVKFLHVGCGRADKTTLPPRYRTMQEVRLDITPTVKPDIVADMRDLSAISENSYDIVYASHNIEHVFAHEVVGVLKQFHRVLKPDGFVEISVPDLQQIGEMLSKGELEGTLYTAPIGPVTPLDMIYGHRTGVQFGNEFMAHKTGFTALTLAKRLHSAEFSDIFIKRYCYNLNAFGYKRVPYNKEKKFSFRQRDLLDRDFMKRE